MVDIFADVNKNNLVNMTMCNNDVPRLLFKHKIIPSVRINKGLERSYTKTNHSTITSDKSIETFFFLIISSVNVRLCKGGYGPLMCSPLFVAIFCKKVILGRHSINRFVCSIFHCICETQAVVFFVLQNGLHRR